MKLNVKWIYFVNLLIYVLLVSACGSGANGAVRSEGANNNSSQTNNDSQRYPDVEKFIDDFCLGEIHLTMPGLTDPYKNMSYIYRETHNEEQLQSDFNKIWRAPFEGKIATIATTYQITSIAPPTTQNGLQVYQATIVWGVPDMNEQLHNVSESMLVAKWDDRFIVVSLDGNMPQKLPDPGTNPDQYPDEGQLISDYCYKLSSTFNLQAIYYQQMSAAYQSNHSADDFNASLSQNLQSMNGIVMGCDLAAVQKITDGSETATVLVSSDSGTEAIVTQTVHMIQEGGKWKIDSIE